MGWRGLWILFWLTGLDGGAANPAALGGEGMKGGGRRKGEEEPGP